ncbi:MAG: hypothetical protein COA52_15480 [Hyphomicrobiales bacterium]|nr:MAG: hypothetical protein COA52_15480 [Hyphomicrobiales bacterium]
MAAGIEPNDLVKPSSLAKLPVMERSDIQLAQDLFCDMVPNTHGAVASSATSGSTGEPVVVNRTILNHYCWLAATMRSHYWCKSDFSKPLAVIRANLFEVTNNKSWGSPVSLLHASGVSMGIPITKTGEELFEILFKFKPSSILMFPGSLASLIGYANTTDRKITSIEVIRTLGETVTKELRELTQKTFGRPIQDSYSSQEFGCIALQCPQSEQYHIMAENLIVEVLDEKGRACKSGQIGRIVITDLLNYATPLVRYAIGDYAEVGTSCECGRGLPTLKRILGRERNLILMPDGRRHWPLVGFDKFRAIAPVRQYQLIQKTLDVIEVRLFVERGLTLGEEAELATHIKKSLGHDFTIEFNYFEDRLPAGASGKFEEFLCLV